MALSVRDLRCARPPEPEYRAGGGQRLQACGIRALGDLLRRPDEQAASTFRALGYLPLEPYPGTNRKWRCRHVVCGTVCTPVFKALVGRGIGCTTCAVSGFKPALPAVVYLITHPQLCAHKIGIAGLQSNRLEKWRQRGWLIYRTLHFDVGADAYKVEQLTLRWLRQERELGARLPPSEHGWSETVDADEIDLPDLWRRIAALATTEKAAM